MMSKTRTFAFSLVLLFFLNAGAFGMNNSQPQTLSERLVLFIMHLLQPQSQKIDETLVRDHL